jgi:TrpR family trp operon transcriptional repressor
MDSFEELVNIFREVDDQETMVKLFRELFTEKEISDIVLRWELMKDLSRGETQRSIAARHGISLCKITRGSRLLKDPASAVGALIEKKFGKTVAGSSDATE